MFAAIDAIRALADHRADQVVVTTMTSLFQWDTVVGDDPLMLPLIGSMSKASSLALGIALARPDRQVWCLDGDGSLLMNLGSLVTIVGAGVTNLIEFVFENGAYNITGGQPTPAAGRVDFPALARAAGFPHAIAIDSEPALRGALPDLIRQPGPTLVCLKVAPAGPQPKLQQGRMARKMVEVTAALAARPATG